MRSVARLLTTKLKLRVNSEKSAVARPWERKFLGFSFTNHKQPKRRLAPKAVARFKERVRELTRRTRGISLARMVHELTEYLRGWIGYFGRCETPSVLEELGQWIRRRLRSMVWKQWKRGTTRYRELRKRGVAAQEAAQTAGSSDGPWHLATPQRCTSLSRTLSSRRSDFPNSRLTGSLTRRTAGCGPACPVVWQGRVGDHSPYADSISTQNCFRKLN